MLGGVLVVPAGIVKQLRHDRLDGPGLIASESEDSENKAVEAVMTAERTLGNNPSRTGEDQLGYHLESIIPGSNGKLRFIDVKTRVSGRPTVTITRNEILTALNKPEDWFLALVDIHSAREPSTNAASLACRFAISKSRLRRRLISQFPASPSIGGICGPKA